MDLDTLCKLRSPYYLQQWIGTFQAYSDQAIRKKTKGGNTVDDSGSSGTFDTEDLDMEEYWVDVNDGMDIEDQLACAGMEERDIINLSSDRGELNIEPKPPW